MIPPFTQEEMDEILAETRRLNYWVEPEKVQGGWIEWMAGRGARARAD